MTVELLATEKDFNGIPHVDVLDKGWVRLIRFDGEDDDVVRAARQSYGEGTTTYRNHQGLIEYLMEHKHTSPFESLEVTVQIKAPIIVVAQLKTHRTLSRNEISARYSVIPDEFYVPADEDVSSQSKDNKQGRGEPLGRATAAWLVGMMENSADEAFIIYKEAIERGMAREIARMVLPQSTYTVLTLKGNLRNWHHFLDLRTHEHAQLETRRYAEAIEQLMRPRAPLSFAAWDEFVRYAVSFSRSDMEIVRDLARTASVVSSNETLREFFGKVKKSRRDEFAKKLGLTDVYNLTRE